MIFNDRIRLLRKEKGLKQDEAASLLGISYRNYQRLEADGEKPQYDTLLKLADTYQVSTDWLMGRTEDRTLHR
jgi:transcriptional regulator with XRE-family HTH domain